MACSTTLNAIRLTSGCVFRLACFLVFFAMPDHKPDTGPKETQNQTDPLPEAGGGEMQERTSTLIPLHAQFQEREASWSAPAPWRFSAGLDAPSGRGLPHSRTMRRPDDLPLPNQRRGMGEGNCG